MRPAAGKSNYDQSGSSKLGEDAWPNIIIVQFTQISRSDAGRCPLWVKSRHRRTSNQCPLYPQKRTLELSGVMSALCQKQTHAPQQSTRGFPFRAAADRNATSRVDFSYPRRYKPRPCIGATSPAGHARSKRRDCHHQRSFLCTIVGRLHHIRAAHSGPLLALSQVFPLNPKPFPRTLATG